MDVTTDQRSGSVECCRKQQRKKLLDSSGVKVALLYLRSARREGSRGVSDMVTRNAVRYLFITE